MNTCGVCVFVCVCVHVSMCGFNPKLGLKQTIVYWYLLLCN